MNFKKFFLCLIISICIVSIASVSANEFSIDDSITIENVECNTIADDLAISENNTNKEDVSLISDNVSMYYKNGSRLNGFLYDNNHNPISNQNLTFTINNVSYSRLTNNDGQASIALNLDSGVYLANISYEGNGVYNSASTTAHVTILSVIESSNLIKYYKNDSSFNAKFLDNQGNPLTNASVSFNVNGNIYNRTTDDKGIAKIAINLNAGNYIISSQHPKGEVVSNNITVLSTIVSKDLVKYCRNGSAFEVCVLDGIGNPLASSNVSFNINGRIYNRISNASGIASLAINLDSGNYIITTTANGEAISNNINVLSTIVSSDLVKYYRNGSAFEVCIVDGTGKALAGSNVSFNIHGCIYNKITNGSGIAKLNINLDPGNYIITTTANSEAISNNVTVLSTIVSKDLVKYYRNGSAFEVCIVDGTGKALAGSNVSFNIHGCIYNRISNASGIAKLNINLDPGNYIITTTANGEAISNNVTVLSTIVSSDLVKYYRNGSAFEVCIVDGTGKALAGSNVSFNIHGCIYNKITNGSGIAKLNINLDPGNYIITTTANGESISNDITVLSTIIAENEKRDYTNQYPYTITYLDSLGNPLKDTTVHIIVDGGIDYTLNTNEEGIVSLPLALSIGAHNIYTENPNDGCKKSTTITIIDDSFNYGYWSFASSIMDIDLNQMSNLGTTDLLVNYYAFTRYDYDTVVNWISEANSYGIRIHIWVQCFYDGEWISPTNDDGSLKYDLYQEIIDEVLYYCSVPGVAGINLDYIRCPGTAYKHPNAVLGINTFVDMLTSQVKNTYPEILISASIMAEPSASIYYYAQDFDFFSEHLDIIIPMIYKGNYEQSSDWIASMTNYYVSHSKGAEIWSGLQGYTSDDVPSPLSYSEMLTDAQNAVNGGASGVIVFRYGLTSYINVDDLVL